MQPKLGIVFLVTLTTISCGQSQEERQKVAQVTCAIMSESRNMDGAFRVEKMNEAREKLGGKPFLEGDDQIIEAFQKGLCVELVLGDGSYEEELRLWEEERERERELWIKEEKLEEERRIARKSQRLQDYAVRTFAERIEFGEGIYANYCSTCHQPDGQGIPPAFPSLTSKQFLGRDKTEHISIVVDGNTRTAMQPYGDLLDEYEIAAVITYTLNSWGNSNSAKIKEVTMEDVVSYME